MKPIAILQHEATQGPGVLEEYLLQHGIAYELISACQKISASLHASDYRGLVVLGSNHCANESLCWIEQERCLLQDALAHGVPVLGHCFGAQMLARAMGAKVWRNPCPNIGWSRVWVTRPAQELLDVPREVTLFNWHYDTFEIPRGAMRSMHGAFCLNKGFVYGRNWAFQGHLEVTEHSVKAWCDEGHEELRHAQGPAAQHEAQILAQLPQHIEQLHATAMHVYGAWTRHLDRPGYFQLGALPAAQHKAWSPAADPLHVLACSKSAKDLLHASGLAMEYQAPLAEKTKEILVRAAL